MENLKNQKIAIGYFKLKTIIIKEDHLFDEYTRPLQFIEKTETSILVVGNLAISR